MTGWTMQYRCIACRSMVGTTLKNGNDEWFWRPVSTGFAGPFCSEDCSSVWAAWPRDRQIAAVFGGYLLGLKLLHRRPQLPDASTSVPLFTEGVDAPKWGATLDAGPILPDKDRTESLHWRDLAWSRS